MTDEADIPAAKLVDMDPLNVLGEPLQPCGSDPMTGFFRDGCCTGVPQDLGNHTVCAVMTTDFLRYQRNAGMI